VLYFRPFALVLSASFVLCTSHEGACPIPPFPIRQSALLGLGSECPHPYQAKVPLAIPQQPTRDLVGKPRNAVSPREAHAGTSDPRRIRIPMTWSSLRPGADRSSPNSSATLWRRWLRLRDLPTTSTRAGS